MGELIQEQLRLKLREEVSGVYGVTAWFWQEPGEDFSSGRISFSSDPERVDELIQQLHLVLKRMADEAYRPIRWKISAVSVRTGCSGSLNPISVGWRRSAKAI